ncbi:hypothetical protein CFOL_v3_00789 [Cephalotus follicularis]|uniref:Uncharacterized protein n=1 Tax=Cephalotus follicularis TaxID=3775 RepID=A0A1Q3ANC3_CEPFO|nr:hypothetical protein CFOL_v3_00789 [Cephalotus follicularis]
MKAIKFEAYWVKEARCEEIMKDTWEDGIYKLGSNNLVSKIRICRDNLSKWCRDSFGLLGWRVSEKKAFLSSFIVDGDVNEIKKSKKELNDLLEMKEIMWRLRSRVARLKDGGKNTKFFHSKAFRR